MSMNYIARLSLSLAIKFNWAELNQTQKKLGRFVTHLCIVSDGFPILDGNKLKISTNDATKFTNIIKIGEDLNITSEFCSTYLLTWQI